MKFQQAAIPLPLLWSSPFVRWQGSLADVSSLDFAAAVTGDALADRQFDRTAIDRIVLGMTIPQAHSFYGAPWLASRLGLPDVSGPLVAQACATSVACLVAAAAEIEADAQALPLVVTTDRTSNGPLLVYPRSQGMGGSPVTENWVLDSFAADPNTGKAMVATAENVAREGAMSRAALDELTLLRWQQYQAALADDRRFQRRWLQPVVLPRGKGKALRVEADEGVHPYTADGRRPSSLCRKAASSPSAARPIRPTAAPAPCLPDATGHAAWPRAQAWCNCSLQRSAASTRPRCRRPRRARPCLPCATPSCASRTCASSSATTRSPSTTCGSRSRPAFRWSG
jgi:acetyl-CoA C-acetyltransferase